MYRNNATAKVMLDSSGTSLRLELPLLRIREAPGVQVAADPKPGADLKAAWLSTSSRPTGTVSLRYRETHVTEWLNEGNARRVTSGAGPSGVLQDPDAPDWGRFWFQDRHSKPVDDGAPLLLEYGAVGSNVGREPTFLVGIWASSPPSSGGVPTERDMVAFYHPSTAKTWFPTTSFPFRSSYPYPVTVNTPALENDPKDPDRIFQPYVNLALKYSLGRWSPFVANDQKMIIVVPIMPHVTPGRNPAKRSQDELENGLPFRTQSGMSRLLTEVNLFLHQRRYGWPGLKLDDWWGMKKPTGQPLSPADSTSLFTDERPAPKMRRIALATFSSSSPLLNTALTTVNLASMHYPPHLWGVLDAQKSFQPHWVETWCLDPFLDNNSVQAAEFEKNLLSWFHSSQSRRFVLANSGTTGGGNPGKLYPTIQKLSSTRTRQATTDAKRFAEVWWGPDMRWIGMFCSNPYLSAATDVTSLFPPFTAHPSGDDAHGFMHVLAVGMALHWTALGRP
ncbi:hypothetical protein SAMN06272781_0015 [Streptomyces sp. 1222.2]|nr:hypothetical protein SAMN06272781_0015 [Streptomyces sp. 1222.2]